MHFKIKYKLFFSFTLTMFTVIFLIVILMQWNFQRGFLNYINEVEASHLATISYKLKQIYQEDHSWKSIQENQHLWEQIIDPIPKNNPDKKIHLAYESLDVSRRIILFDPQYHRIFGFKKHTYSFKTQAIVLNGVTIGYLGIQPLEDVNKKVDLHFAQQQIHMIYMIALFALMIMALVTILISHRITQPIKQLLLGTKSLTSGNFQAQIQVTVKDELAVLAEHFNILARTLAKNRLQQRQWIADISHELRTPLAILHGELQAIEDGVRKFDVQTLHSLSSEVIRLNKLIEDLYQLSLADIGSLRYEHKVLNLTSLLTERATQFNDRIQQHRLYFNIHMPEIIMFRGDAQRLQQLFTNLLENSIRYTNANGRIWLHCHVEAQEIIINLEDSKPAVPNSALMQLFERLYRVENSRSREYGGGGLGLTICKSIVQAHGGNIAAEHSLLGGLCIQIKLPFDPKLNKTM